VEFLLEAYYLSTVLSVSGLILNEFLNAIHCKPTAFDNLTPTLLFQFISPNFSRH
jgi:hypothetical protein